MILSKSGNERALSATHRLPAFEQRKSGPPSIAIVDTENRKGWAPARGHLPPPLYKTRGGAPFVRVGQGDQEQKVGPPSPKASRAKCIMKLRWKPSTTLSVESGLRAWSESLPRSALLAHGNDPAMEWLDHYLQCFLTGHALRRNVSMQIGKTRFRLLQSGDPETCLSDLKRPIDGTQPLQRKNSEKVGLLVRAEPHAEFSGSF